MALRFLIALLWGFVTTTASHNNDTLSLFPNEIELLLSSLAPSAAVEEGVVPTAGGLYDLHNRSSSQLIQRRRRRRRRRRRLGINDGNMPAWKARMIKERSTGSSETAKGIWHKWLKRTQKETMAAKRGGTLAAGRLGSNGDRGSIVGSGDPWRECGAMPRISDVFKEGPHLGKIPIFYIYTDEPFQFKDLLPCYKERFGVDAWEDERMWELCACLDKAVRQAVSQLGS